jgi:hypothetical protein
VEAGRIEERRESALHHLAELLGETGDDGIEWITGTMRELPTSRWHREEDPDHGGPPGLPDDLTAPSAAAPAPAVEETTEIPAAQAEPEPERRPWNAVRPAFLGALVIVALVALVVTLAGNDDSDDSSSSSSARPSAAPSTSLGHVTGPSSGSGSVAVTRGGTGAVLHLRVKGLAPPAGGGYVVWLYNSITDAHDLGGALRGSFTLDAPLPANYRGYRFVDVSREPSDGNRNHSGQSVLRAPLPR